MGIACLGRGLFRTSSEKSKPPMNYLTIKKLPTPDELNRRMPLSNRARRLVGENRQAIARIIEGQDARMLVVVGPCSAWPKPAVLQYAERLKALDEHVKDALNIVMRVYVQKPRTTGGWMGPIHQPDPLMPADLEIGAWYAREMMVQIAEMGLPIANEVLFTHHTAAFLEPLSWAVIGARSAEDQEHRMFASALGCPVGLKHPTSGSLSIGVNSVLVAQQPHIAAFDGCEVQTHGNAHAHLVLRGSREGGPNYGVDHLKQVQLLIHHAGICHPAVIVDASHDNALIDGQRRYEQQIEVVRQVMCAMVAHPDLKLLVKGFMLESFLKPGAQRICPQNSVAIDLEGLSITDPCLGWDQTESLLFEMAQSWRRLHECVD